MVRKGAKKADEALPRVIIHPELHRQLMQRRVDTGQPVQQSVHEILCRSLKRLDLLPQNRPESAAV